MSTVLAPLCKLLSQAVVSHGRLESQEAAVHSVVPGMCFSMSTCPATVTDLTLLHRNSHNVNFITSRVQILFYFFYQNKSRTFCKSPCTAIISLQEKALKTQNRRRPPQDLRPGGGAGVKEPYIVVEDPIQCKRIKRKRKGPIKVKGPMKAKGPIKVKGPM